VAGAAEQLAASVHNVTTRVAEAAGMARAAAAADASASDATLRALTEAAGQIGEVVRLIERYRRRRPTCWR
jgi:methyl-accepting chemotaxis protein